MGSSASVNGTSQSVIDLSIEEFPKLGVKLSFYADFVEKCGGVEKLEGLTTTEVCEQFVKPSTNEVKLSFCELLKAQDHPAVGVAEVFISHAWKYKFLDVLEAIKYHFRNQPDIIIWFDLFSNNQHDTTNRAFEWWCNTFKSAIASFGHVVMVMAPWTDPIPLTRAWCLFELYCTADTKSKFEVALSQREQAVFLDDIAVKTKDKINDMLAIINCEKSEAFNQKDKELIFSVVQQSVGFNKINQLVFEQIRSWMVECTEQAMLRVEENKEDQYQLKHAVLQHTLGNVCFHQGSFAKAESALESCWSARKILLGEEHEDTLSALSDLCIVYKKLAKYAVVEPLLVDLLEKRRALQGTDHPDTLETMLTLASVYKYLRKEELAEKLYIECYEKRLSSLGEAHVDTLAAMNNLAVWYHDHSPDKAEALYTKCFELKAATLGENHLGTLSTAGNLASFYVDVKKFDQAEKLFHETIAKKIVMLGDNHTSVLSAIDLLGRCYQMQQKYSEEEPLRVSCLAKYRVVLGDNHPYTLTAMSYLSQNYIAQGKYDLALPLIQEGRARSRENLGETDRTTKSFLYLLGIVTSKMNINTVSE